MAATRVEDSRRPPAYERATGGNLQAQAAAGAERTPNAASPSRMSRMCRGTTPWKAVPVPPGVAVKLPLAYRALSSGREVPGGVSGAPSTNQEGRAGAFLLRLDSFEL